MIYILMNITPRHRGGSPWPLQLDDSQPHSPVPSLKGGSEARGPGRRRGDGSGGVGAADVAGAVEQGFDPVGQVVGVRLVVPVAVGREGSKGSVVARVVAER